MHLVTALGMIGVVMLAIGAILLFFRGSSSQDLGTVSHQWVVRHRLGQPDDWGR